MIETYCACCRLECKPTKLENSFSHGLGIEYPHDYGALVSDCCEDYVLDTEGNRLDWKDIHNANF